MSNEARVPMVQLPSGVCLSLDNIALIARKEITQFAVFYPNCGQVPTITLQDMAALKAIGFVQEAPEPEAANDAPRIAPAA